MDPHSPIFCLRWNNHRNNLLNVLDQLLQTESFCDVTLACDGASVKCHKMILSACSSYFQQLFLENNCEHPIVFLKDIKYEEIRAILDYMYKGEVNVAQDHLPGLLKVAELLKVKGLVEEEREKLLHSGVKEGRPLVVTTTRDDEDNKHKVNGDEKTSRDPPPQPIPPRPFMGGPQFPLWPLPGMFPGAHNLFNRAAAANSSAGENGNASSSSSTGEATGHSNADKDGSPSPKEGSSSAKRKKTASGSGGSTCSKESGLGSMPPLVGMALNNSRDRDELNNGGHDGPHSLEMRQDKMHGLNDLKQGLLPMPPGLLPNGPGQDKEGEGIANYVPNQRLEWKRYKQYTRTDIMAAIEEVKKGMSALQASRKYGVPSRTLYDKVKKMGIVTGRQVQRKSLPQYPASFPSLNMMNLDSYKDMAERMKDLENDDSNSHPGTPGDALDGRATLVPPGGGFPTLQMLNIMERMKENERNKANAVGSGLPSEISLTPMNLSTMLSRGSRADLATLVPLSAASSSSDHRPAPGTGFHAPNNMSESSMSPNGGDDIDMDDEEENNASHVSEVEERMAAARERHPSADIRAQFMADLRRLGGNLPPPQMPHMPHMPPPTTSLSLSKSSPPRSTSSPPPSISSSSSTTKGDESLPPRKRKVSLDPHEQSPTEKFNGSQDKQEEPTSSSCSNSAASSPEKAVVSTEGKKPGDAIGEDSNSLQDCRN